MGLLIRLGLQAIADYLEKNRRPDLVGGGSDNVKKSGRPGDGKSTIAVTSIDGAVVYGTNSTYHKYSAEDEARATRMRDTLIKKHPDFMPTGNTGQFPNYGLFHAEATVLLRAARDRGGTLAGRTLEIIVNNGMCPACQRVLPLLALELGNPTLFFTDLHGRRYLVRDGQIKEVMR